MPALDNERKEEKGKENRPLVYSIISQINSPKKKKKKIEVNNIRDLPGVRVWRRYRQRIRMKPNKSFIEIKGKNGILWLQVFLKGLLEDRKWR